MHFSAENRYIALCLLLPFGWGILSSRVFDAIQNHRQRRETGDTPLSPDPELVTYDI